MLIGEVIGTLTAPTAIVAGRYQQDGTLRIVGRSTSVIRARSNGVAAVLTGAPVHTDPHDFWLHLEVLTIRRAEGKIKYLAGSESAMAAFVNDISPEVGRPAAS